jgi:hypothetical protein
MDLIGLINVFASRSICQLIFSPVDVIEIDVLVVDVIELDVLGGAPEISPLLSLKFVNNGISSKW